MKKPTENQWKNIINLMEKNLHKSIYIGDEFGKYYYEHFLNCLPPITYSSDFVLCSEPYSNSSDGEIYIGIYKNNNTWFGIATTVNNFNEILKSRKDWNNPDRTRYYGLCIGDKVEVKFGAKPQYGIVNNFNYFDNNRVQLQINNTLNTWVAEHCKRI